MSNEVPHNQARNPIIPPEREIVVEFEDRVADVANRNRVILLVEWLDKMSSEFIRIFKKDPEEELEYGFDYEDALGGDVIDSSIWKDPMPVTSGV